MADLNDPKSSGSKKSKRSHSGNGCGCFRCFGRLCPCLRASPSPDALLKNLGTPGVGQPLNAVVVRARDSPTSIPDQPYQPYGPWAERVGQDDNRHFYYEGVPPKDKRPRTAPSKRSEGGEVLVEDDNRKRPSSAPTATVVTKVSRTSERALRNPVSRKVKVTAL